MSGHPSFDVLNIERFLSENASESVALVLFRKVTHDLTLADLVLFNVIHGFF